LAVPENPGYKKLEIWHPICSNPSLFGNEKVVGDGVRGLTKSFYVEDQWQTNGCAGQTGGLEASDFARG
jgi:hypothetical protein